MRLHALFSSTILVVILVCLAAILPACSAADAGNPTNIQGRAVIQAAPDFQLSDLQGQTVSLSGLRGKVVVLNFWSTT